MIAPVEVRMCDHWQVGYANELQRANQFPVQAHQQLTATSNGQSHFASDRIAGDTDSNPPKQISSEQYAKGSEAYLSNSGAHPHRPAFGSIRGPQAATNGLRVQPARGNIHNTFDQNITNHTNNSHFYYTNKYYNYYATAAQEQHQDGFGCPRPTHQQLVGNPDYYPPDYGNLQQAREELCHPGLQALPADQLGPENLLHGGVPGPVEQTLSHESYYAGPNYNSTEYYQCGPSQQHPAYGNRYCQPSLPGPYVYQPNFAPAPIEQPPVGPMPIENPAHAPHSDVRNHNTPVHLGQLQLQPQQASRTRDGFEAGAPCPSESQDGQPAEGTTDEPVLARRKNASRESTATLKDWLEEHGQNPYPTKGEKIMLSIITKMSLTQVSTWFANARRRIKKENREMASMWSQPGTSSGSGAQNSSGTASIRYFIQRHQKQLAGSASSMLASLGVAESAGQCKPPPLMYSCRSLALAAAASASRQRQMQARSSRSQVRGPLEVKVKSEPTTEGELETETETEVGSTDEQN